MSKEALDHQDVTLNLISYFLAHLRQRLKWAILIEIFPLSARRYHYKLFTFSTSSQEPQDQFQPNMALDILGYRRFKLVQMNDNTLFQREIIAN